MTPSQLEFNLAVREWANEVCYSIIPSGSDDKITIKYANRQGLFEDRVEEIKREVCLRIKEIACRHDTEIDLEFTDLGFDDLGLIVYLKEPAFREEAKAEYYDLLYLGPRRTDDQHARLQALIKKYGFK